MKQRQLQVIDYLGEGNRVLREQSGARPLFLNDDQRSRLALKSRLVGRRIRAEVATIVTPETRLAWHRRLITQKYDRRLRRRPGRLERPRKSKRWWSEWHRRTATGATRILGVLEPDPAIRIQILGRCVNDP